MISDLSVLTVSYSSAFLFEVVYNNYNSNTTHSNC